MNAPPRHVPFDSIYRPDFEVVEERHGKVSLFPHTEQLPRLLRALNLEFYGALPGHIARTDQRGDGFHKFLTGLAALMFCNAFNAGRQDGVHVYPLPDEHLVTRLTVVQQITEKNRLGPFHRFRFYGRDGFIPEIHLSGKRLAFADHVLQRFSDRVPSRVGENLSSFLTTFYGCWFVSFPVGRRGRAFVLPLDESLVAFTYTETPEEYFVTTCLTVNEIHSMQPEAPVHALNLHYGREFVRPKIRNWNPIEVMIDLYERWQRKIPPLPPPEIPATFKNWNHFGQYIKDTGLRWGHGPGTRVCFVDHIPGPMVFKFKPGEQEGAFDELAICREMGPGLNWEAAFAEREALTSESPEEHQRRRRQK